MRGSVRGGVGGGREGGHEGGREGAVRAGVRRGIHKYMYTMYNASVCAKLCSSQSCAVQCSAVVCAVLCSTHRRYLYPRWYLVRRRECEQYSAVRTQVACTGSNPGSASALLCCVLCCAVHIAGATAHWTCSVSHARATQFPLHAQHVLKWRYLISALARYVV